MLSTSVYYSGFDVGTSPPSPIQVTVKSGAGTIDCTAQPGGIITLIPISHRENHVLYYGVSADVIGAFSIRSVAPAEYKLFAWHRIPAGAYFSAEFLSKYEDMGRPVLVTSDSKLKAGPAVIKRGRYHSFSHLAEGDGGEVEGLSGT